tara:strand:+ start:558 stop:1136 length:579 start_codon:yes stop_codon:yes gene_type:complete
MRFKIFKFKSVTSTNDVAINLIKKKKRECGCIVADRQTKGRGTNGKKWISERGNLFTTIFFHLKDSYPPFNEFAIVNPVIISKVIQKYCDKKNIAFKWPNDILVNKKKICGILQEHIIFNSKKFLIVGIGLNVISNPSIKDKYMATNIFSETKKNLTTSEIVKLIILSYKNFFYDLQEYDYLSFKKKVKLIK